MTDHKIIAEKYFEPPLAFSDSHAVGMRLTDADQNLWQVYDNFGNIIGADLTETEAEVLLGWGPEQ